MCHVYAIFRLLFPHGWPWELNHIHPSFLISLSGLLVFSVPYMQYFQKFLLVFFMTSVHIFVSSGPCRSKCHLMALKDFKDIILNYLFTLLLLALCSVWQILQWLLGAAYNSPHLDSFSCFSMILTSVIWGREYCNLEYSLLLYVCTCVWAFLCVQECVWVWVHIFVEAWS